MGDENNSLASHIRIPVLETMATSFGSIGRGFPLTSREREMAEKVFGNSIILSDVRIIYTTIAAAPTTLGNNIRFAPSYPKEYYDSTLIHELTHVWQYQNHGSSYISNSALHQLSAIVGGGDRNGAYNYEFVYGSSFSYYTAEHQAMIVEDYFKKGYFNKAAFDKYYDDNPDKKNELEYKKYQEYQKLLAEVRSSNPRTSPLKTNIDKYNEALYGNYGSSKYFDTPSSVYPSEKSGRTVPIFRLEW